MKWIQIALLIIQMLWKYGPTMWKLGNDIYHEVEGHIAPEGTKPTSTEKAAAFNRIAVTESVRKYKEIPKRSELNRFREDVWKRNNINKVAKRIEDARLRALQTKRRNENG